eukprot:UN11159
MAAFNMNLSANHIAVFTKTPIDSVIQSEKFNYDGCVFYIECTPNGYSKTSSRPGECVLWLAIASPPNDIEKLDVSFTFVCREIDYYSKRRRVHLGFCTGAIYSAGIENPILITKKILKILKNIRTLSFECHINIHDKIQKKESLTKSDSLVLGQTLVLLSILLGDHDDEKTEMSNLAHISPYRIVKHSSPDTYRLLLTYFGETNKYEMFVKKQPLSSGHFKT